MCADARVQVLKCVCVCVAINKRAYMLEKKNIQIYARIFYAMETMVMFMCYENFQYLYTELYNTYKYDQRYFAVNDYGNFCGYRI